MKAAMLLFVLFAMLVGHSLAATSFASDTKDTWITFNNGLNLASMDIRTVFSFQGDVYLGSRGTNSGIYKWTGSTWQRIMSLPSPSGMTEPVCDQQYCYVVASNQYFQFRPQLNGNYTRLPNGFFAGEELSLANGYLFVMGGNKNNQVQRLNTKSTNFTVDGWTLLTAQAAIPETFAGGSQYIAATNDGSVYINSAFVKKVFRWSPGLQLWHDVTYDLDTRNQLGACCGPVGQLSTAPNGEDVYISTEQGIFMFRGSTWYKVTAHWGNKEVYLFGKYLFSNNLRWELPGPVDSMPYTTPANVRLRFLNSPNDGKTLVALFVNTTNNSVIGLGRYTFTDRADADPATIQSYNLNLNYASYFGSAGVDDAIGAVVGKNLAGNQEQFILAGNYNNTPVGLESVTSQIGFADANSQGYLIFINPFNGQVPLCKRIGRKIADLATNKNGNIAVAVTEGIIVFNRDASQIIWSVRLNNTHNIYKVAIATDGHVAALGQNRTQSGFQRVDLFLFNSIGNLLNSIDVSDNGVHDVEISSEENAVWWSGHNQVITGASNGLQLARLKCYSINPNLEFKYATFDFSRDQLTATGNTADTRIYKLHYGLDGYLYFLGESAGGVSVMRYNGFDLTTRVLITPDSYSDPFNLKGSAHLLVYGRINPKTGQVLKAQWSFPRLPSDFSGNTMQSSKASIAVNAQGQIFIAGVAACCIQSRDLNRVNCEKVGAYKGGDSYLMVISADFKQRLRWTPLNKNGGADDGRGVAVGTTIAGAFFDAQPGQFFTTTNALHATMVSPTATDTYFASWLLEQPEVNCTAQVLADQAPYTNPDSPPSGIILPTVLPTPTPSLAAPVSSSLLLVVLAICVLSIWY